MFRLLLPNFDQFMAAEATQKDIAAMVRFLRNLKTLVRATNCVCLISVEESLLKPHLTSNLRFLADQVIQVTSFKDHSEMKIGEYDGTLKLLKQVKIHGFICSPLPDTDIYALKVTRKDGLTVERIHLDPEEDRAGQDENLMQKGTKEKKSVSSMACNPTK